MPARETAKRTTTLTDKQAIICTRISRLMRLMSLIPIYQKPNASKAAKGHKT